MSLYCVEMTLHITQALDDFPVRSVLCCADFIINEPVKHAIGLRKSCTYYIIIIVTKV